MTKKKSKKNLEEVKMNEKLPNKIFYPKPKKSEIELNMIEESMDPKIRAKDKKFIKKIVIINKSPRNG